MKLTKKQLNTLYQVILNAMSAVDRKTPVGYIETLQELKLIISKYYDNSKTIRTMFYRLLVLVFVISGACLLSFIY